MAVVAGTGIGICIIFYIVAVRSRSVYDSHRLIGLGRLLSSSLDVRIPERGSKCKQAPTPICSALSRFPL